MDKSEYWKHLLHKLNCVTEDQIGSPRGFELTLEFAESDSKFNYSSRNVGDSVTLYIDGIFFRFESGSSHTYLPIDQLANVVLTVIAA